MIKRLFWLGLGIGAGVVVYRVLSRKAEAYTPHGIAASAQESAVGLLDSVREFMADVREAAAEREEQIHAALAENAEFGDGPHLDDLPEEGDTDR
ncbi:MAG: hypothetical protein ACRDT6_23815 [Micromonosporaceae bacterium]